MARLSIEETQISKIINLLKHSEVPPELESSTHSFKQSMNRELLANAYFAIVAICHQTSPIGERRLEGNIDSTHKIGWDYLKEKFLVNAFTDAKWASPSFWTVVNPIEMSAAFDDQTFGKTLNRINERAFLLNDLGEKLEASGHTSIEQAYLDHSNMIGGDSGFLTFLNTFQAYSDPVKKKSLFFLSIMKNELGWTITDIENLLSPVDYHEIRGHLRIGTIRIDDAKLCERVIKGLVLTEQEDTEIRETVQTANNQISEATGISSSAIHYMFWNVFRNCCPRDPQMTHCQNCPPRCGLPKQYKEMPSYHKRCVFSEFCNSAGKPIKVIEPPYIGHYY